ncbi:MAG TPA: glucose-1-phosphate cytidylyltransferase [Candidatus Binatia bacterium]|nr:glucose-1-phosphate cytidylyltransferase [Candidatus Binatia bacterium]
MKVVILCGGQGTRMREETEFRPKPLVAIGRHPILWHIMQIYAHFDYREFVLCLGYKGSMIKEYFLNYEALSHDLTVHLGSDPRTEIHRESAPDGDFAVTLADTGEQTMTGGRIGRVARYLDGDTFMVTYGDAVANVDVARLVRFHRSHGRLATVTCVRPPSRFGSLALGHGAQVQSFVEKPRLEGWVNAGFFVFNRGVVDYLDGDECVLEGAPLERMARDGQLRAFRHEGAWYPMDTYREVLMLNEIWASGNAPWQVW